MASIIEYYFAPQSPWSYLGHERLRQIARNAGATISVLPVDLGRRVFPVSGGLPLSQRAPQRQAYRLVELRRFSNYLGIALNPEPKFFPVDPTDAARLIIAVDMKDGTEAALDLTGALMRAVWVEERNIGNELELAAIVEKAGLPSRRIEDAHSQAVAERYEADSQKAVEAGVFGAPTYVVDGELFWGQDRLDFVERRLVRHAD